MHRFFITEEIKDDVVVVSDAAQFHHLKNVLRLKKGDDVIVCDRHGDEFVCGILEIEKARALLVIGERKAATAKKISITVACAIPKKGKLDEIVDSLTQLGVESIIPVETERAVVRLDDARKEARLERWRSIARSAAQQSQRSTVPEVREVTPFEKVLSMSGDYDLKLLPTLHGERRHIKDVLSHVDTGKILALIGPEGDFSPGEVEMAKRVGFIPVSLGDSVLRVNTAAIAVVSYIRISAGV